jgi:hypothetical protein
MASDGWSWKEISVIQGVLRRALFIESLALSMLGTEIFLRRWLFRSIPKSLLDSQADRRALRKVLSHHLLDLLGRQKAWEVDEAQRLYGKFFGFLAGLVVGILPLRFLYVIHQWGENYGANFYRKAGLEFERQGILVLRPELGETMERAETREYDRCDLFKRIRTGRTADAYFQTLD